MLTLSLTVDHQTIDGAVAAAFMRRLPAGHREARASVQVNDSHGIRSGSRRSS